jgi:hypothetical protein
MPVTWSAGGILSYTSFLGTNVWNQADKDAGITLTNGNLTFSGDSAAFHAVRAVNSASTGKKYWEVHCDLRNSPAANARLGFGTVSATLSNYVGFDANAIGWAGNGVLYHNNVVFGTTIQIWSQGDTLCFALDTSGVVWFRTNGGNWNNDILANQNPATGAGGFGFTPLTPCFAMGAAGNSGTGNDTYTANFGGAAYAQPAPAGFGNW